MLKALELVGFKSFADKTLFEFPPGVTVVVGPNGSGKSNVVDAIKWVLGEQSVKSLRGKEMADVIFKGSGTGTRRAHHTAEVTLSMDNTSGFLALDTAEVHVTRRVYRSGEGEYEINRQPCRLRDIRDLFAGTGVATEAYSVIEQGKVDALLKASPRDRRMIFEEAAGISRFKAKKVESLRRMDRVEQNLLRLSDIVEEVDSRLRSVRMQASKASRYQDYTDRLQQLRTQVGMSDWRALSQQLDTFRERTGTLQSEADELTRQSEQIDREAAEVDQRIDEIDRTLNASEARIAQIRQRIGACESTISHQRTSSDELHAELASHRRHAASLGERAGDLQQQMANLAAELESAQEQHRQMNLGVAEQERSLSELNTKLDALRQQNQQRRGDYLERVRQVAVLENRISSLGSQVESLRATRDRRAGRVASMAAEHTALEVESETTEQELERLAADVEDRNDELAGAQSLLAHRRRQLSDRQAQLTALQQRHTAAQERSTVLQELEKRLEGVSAGVKEVLVQARAASANAGPLSHVRGLVADLLQVSVETAPLIEVALGLRAQHVVVARGEHLVEHLQAQSAKLAGRVGFIRLDALPLDTVAKDAATIDLEGKPGVLGRADRFVQARSEVAGLVKHLLGGTWIVEKLQHAVSLADQSGGGLRFVTLAGELLEADGTMVVGPLQAASGLISRRSELRVLREQVEQLAERISQQRSSLEEIEQQIEQDEQRLEGLSREYRQASDALGEQRVTQRGIEERISQLCKRQESIAAEVRAADEELQQAQQALATARRDLQINETALADVESHLSEENRHIDELELRRAKQSQEANAARVEMAKSEQRLDHLGSRMQQAQKDQQERHRAVEESRAQLAQCAGRQRQCERSILQAESEAAELYLRREATEAETSHLATERDTLREERGGSAKKLQALRTQLHAVEKKIHEVELAAGEVTHQRASLAQRMLEDYDVDLAKTDTEPQDDQQVHAREEVEQEIDDLRRKVNNMGGVNLDALHELEGLESRHLALTTQFDDLTAAKESLGQIITRINADSRRLFAETLDAVRENFSKLFRKAFGGGTADIVLEEDVDILDSGIEIVATPPGKGQLSTSLLSGGERALTAVTLLLAIFKYRPSPFCVLDEVDAPLDEANVDRFIRLLGEFPKATQFIVISHSKKTMTAANTLYGITMQESGVSKRVSVRFDEEAPAVKSGDTPNKPAAAEDEDVDESDDTQAA
jgi:chromosome segregation protein